jgi:hypothetical protein
MENVVGDAKMQFPEDELMVSKRDLKTRYGRHDTTIWRWRTNPAVGFPKPDLVLNGREFWRLGTLRKYEEQNQPAPETV